MRQTQKVLIGLIFASLIAVLALILLRRDPALDLASGTTGNSARTGGLTEPLVPSGMTESQTRDPSIASQSRWLRQPPVTTVSNSPADMIKQRSRDRDDPCRGLHGHWRDVDSNELVLAPHGRGTWLADGREPISLSWACRKVGDIELLLQDKTIVLKPEPDGRLGGQGVDGQSYEWTRIDQASN